MAQCSQDRVSYSPKPHLRSAEPRVIAEDETGLGTISFSFSANTDRDYEEKESLWDGNMLIIIRKTPEYSTEFPESLQQK